jgi:hypothetical protein
MDSAEYRSPIGQCAQVLAMWKTDGVTYHLAQARPLAEIMVVAVDATESLRIASCCLAPYELWAWLLLSDEARTEAAEVLLTHGVVTGLHNGH